jgi:transposase
MLASPAGQRVSDYTGAAALLSTLPPAKALLADRGYDANRLREALVDRNHEVCIPAKSNRKIQIPHDKALYRKRHKIENMLGKLKDWRRIHTRYDRCAHTFMSAMPSQQSSSSGYDQRVLSLTFSKEYILSQKII